MKVLKGVILPVLMIMLLASGVMAKGYGKGTAGGAMGGGVSQMQPGVSQLPSFGGGQDMVFYTGKVSNFNLDNQEIILSTEVPGLLGPQTRDVPFKLDRDSTLTICFRSINACESSATASEGWDMISSLNKFSSIAGADKSAIVIGDPATGRVVHVQIDYLV